MCVCVRACVCVCAYVRVCVCVCVCVLCVHVLHMCAYQDLVLTLFKTILSTQPLTTISHYTLTPRMTNQHCVLSASCDHMLQKGTIDTHRVGCSVYSQASSRGLSEKVCTMIVIAFNRYPLL